LFAFTVLTARVSLYHSELLQANRPTPAAVKTIYEHLRRVGLEQYAAVLEFNGIATEQDLSGTKLDDLKKLSIELQFDSSAHTRFGSLLDAENKRFWTDSYALAEVSHIRELFLTAYTARTEIENVRSVCVPLARQHSHSSVEYAECHEAEESDDETGSARLSSEGSNTSDGSLDSEARPMGPEVLTEAGVRELSKAFCAALSSGGKGVISHYNLRRLIDAHPGRPVQCLQAASAFTAPRDISSQIVKHLDLYSFLKRMGLGQRIHSVVEADVVSLSALVEMKGSVTEIAENARRMFKIDKESAFRIAEIITKTSSESGNLLNFALPPRSRVMEVFRLFYTAGAAAFPRYTDTPSVAEEAAASETGTDAESLQAEGGTDSVAPADHATLDPLQLERLAFEFGEVTSNAHGTSLVSLLEVLDHLRRHPLDPAAAVSAAQAELVSPPYPAAPVVVPPPPPALEWVDEWLRSAPGGDLACYALKFKDQGFVNKEDFLYGTTLSLDELDKIGVCVLAHKRRLATMHAKLLSEVAAQ
jgi:hypothetical protein